VITVKYKERFVVRMTSTSPGAEGLEPYDALIHAIRNNDAATVHDLLMATPSLKRTINCGTEDLGFGATPLIAAVQRGNPQMIDDLLAAGADPAVKSDWWAGGFSVLESASDDLLPFLVDRGAVVDVTAAARFGMLEELTAILAGDPAAAHVRSGDGKTPLHWARDVATARLLVEHGADINARDIDHESTAAQYLVRDQPDVARYLVAQGCDADIFLAAALGDVELARRILDADPAAVEMVIGTASFPMRNPRAGGTIYVWTLGQGKTPHSVALEFGHRDVFALLMERSPDPLKLAQACVLGDEALFERFLALNPELARSLPPAMQQQIVVAALNNNTAAVRLMLRAGWPVDARGPNGGTPLHWAAWHGNVAMLREILKHHPPLEMPDTTHHGTPLGWALHGSLHGWHAKDGDYAGAVTALLRAGARADQPLTALEGSDAALAAYRREATEQP
jgi:ankyrin repeat protein